MCASRSPRKKAPLPPPVTKNCGKLLHATRRRRRRAAAKACLLKHMFDTCFHAALAPSNPLHPLAAVFRQKYNSTAAGTYIRRIYAGLHFSSCPACVRPYSTVCLYPFTTLRNVSNLFLCLSVVYPIYICIAFVQSV